LEKKPTNEALKKKTPTVEQPIKKPKHARTKGDIPNYLKTTENQSNRLSDQSEADNLKWDKNLRDGKTTERLENGKHRSNSIKKNENPSKESDETKKNYDAKLENYDAEPENCYVKPENYDNTPQSEHVTNDDESEIHNGRTSNASESGDHIGDRETEEKSSPSCKRSILKTKDSSDREDSQKSSDRSKTRSCSFAEESVTLYYTVNNNDDNNLNNNEYTGNSSVKNGETDVKNGETDVKNVENDETDTGDSDMNNDHEYNVFSVSSDDELTEIYEGRRKRFCSFYDSPTSGEDEVLYDGYDEFMAIGGNTHRSQKANSGGKSGISRRQSGAYGDGFETRSHSNHSRHRSADKCKDDFGGGNTSREHNIGEGFTNITDTSQSDGDVDFPPSVKELTKSPRNNPQGNHADVLNLEDEEEDEVTSSEKTHTERNKKEEKAKKVKTTTTKTNKKLTKTKPKHRKEAEGEKEVKGKSKTVVTGGAAKTTKHKQNGRTLKSEEKEQVNKSISRALKPKTNKRDDRAVTRRVNKTKKQKSTTEKNPALREDASAHGTDDRDIKRRRLSETDSSEKIKPESLFCDIVIIYEESVHQKADQITEYIKRRGRVLISKQPHLTSQRERSKNCSEDMVNKAKEHFQNMIKQAKFVVILMTEKLKTDTNCLQFCAYADRLLKPVFSLLLDGNLDYEPTSLLDLMMGNKYHFDIGHQYEQEMAKLLPRIKDKLIT